VNLLTTDDGADKTKTGSSFAEGIYKANKARSFYAAGLSVMTREKPLR
jgi:hypothetical protein